MRTLILILTTLFFGSLSFAQDALLDESFAVVSFTTNSNTSPSNYQELRSKYYSMHTEAAKAQINNHLANHVFYPDEMIQNRIDGFVTAKIHLTNSGKIETIEIIKSLNDVFDEEVITVFERFDHVDVQESSYYGIKTFQVPVEFTAP